MAIIFCDGFELSTKSGLLTDRYTSTKGLTAISPEIYSGISVSGRNAVRLFFGTTASWVYLTRTVPVASIYRTTFSWQFINPISGTRGSTGLVMFGAGSTMQVTLRLNTDGTISVVRGGTSGTVLATSAVTCSASTWYHFEVYTKIDATVGEIAVWLDGTEIFNLTGVNTQAGANTNITTINLGSDVTPGGNSTQSIYDNFIIADSLQPRMGMAVVATVYPKEAGTTSTWSRTPNAVNVAYNDIGTATAYGTVTNVSYPFDGGMVTSTSGTTPTYASATFTGSGIGIGIDLGRAITIDSYRLVHDAVANATSTYKIQGSSNNSTWNDLYSYSSTQVADSGIVAFASPGTYRYWRVYSTAPTTGTWRLSTFELHSSTSSNWAAVADHPNDSDSSLLYTDVLNNIELFKFTSVSSSPNNILAVAVSMTARDEFGSGNKIAGVARISSTNYAQTGQQLAQGHTTVQSIMNVSPATNAAWTQAEVNGAEFGVKKV